jgi:hypothetical protein
MEDKPTPPGTRQQLEAAIEETNQMISHVKQRSWRAAMRGRMELMQACDERLALLERKASYLSAQMKKYFDSEKHHSDK